MKHMAYTFLKLAALVLVYVTSATAQNFPNRPVRVVVAWPAGSIADVLMRIMSEPISSDLGQPVIVENKPGATGAIGADLVAKSPPDGYTLLFSGSPLNMMHAIGVQTPYKMPDSFTPIVNIAWTPLVLVVQPSLQLRTPQDLVALAKQQPGKLFYAISGTGSPSHFVTELFRARTGIDATPVPFAGSPQTMTAQLAGQVAFHFAATTAALPQIRAGKITALGTTARARLELAPEIPTMEEQGLKNFPMHWNGILGPRGVPMPIAEQLATAFNRAMNRPDVQKRVAPYANDMDGKSTPHTFVGLIKEDYATWAEVARVANIKP